MCIVSILVSLISFARYDTTVDHTLALPRFSVFVYYVSLYFLGKTGTLISLSMKSRPIFYSFIVPTLSDPGCFGL